MTRGDFDHGDNWLPRTSAPRSVDDDPHITAIIAEERAQRRHRERSARRPAEYRQDQFRSPWSEGLHGDL